MKILQRALAISILAAIAAPSGLFAQTITINSVSAPTTCDTAQVTVYYTASGTFGAKNVFTVQLSENGFNNFTNAGLLKTTSSGAIVITIPHGNTWRVRVASSNPYLVSNDNGSNIVVSSSPYADFTVMTGEDSLGHFYQNQNYGGIAYTLLGDTVEFIANSGGISYAWNFGDGATPSTSTDSMVLVSYGTIGFKHVSLTVTNAAGCSHVNTSTPIGIFDCNPSIPSTAAIDSVQNGFSAYYDTATWVVPGGLLNLNRNTDSLPETVFAEPGTTVNVGSNYYHNIIYLKAGSVYLDGEEGNIVIYEPGASISRTGYGSIYLECPSLTFNYTNAPPYSITWLAGVAPTSQPEVNISVYPDPATNLVSIESQEIPQRISVRNELGEEVLQDAGPIRTSKFSFDVSQFASGNYYIELDFGGRTQVRKFSVRR